MENGYIKLYRSFRDWYGYKSHKRLALWVELLFCASHKEKECLFEGKFTLLKPGQFVTGRKLLSSATGVSESQVERILTEFERIGQIEQQKCNTSRLITIVKWLEFQDKDNKRTTDGQRTDNKRTTDGHNQEYKNGRIEEVEEAHTPKPHKPRFFIPPSLEEINKYCTERNSCVDPQVFFDKGEANGWVDKNGNKYRDWKAVIRTWERYERTRGLKQVSSKKYL